jgi:hypothetical protein
VALHTHTSRTVSASDTVGQLRAAMSQWRCVIACLQHKACQRVSAQPRQMAKAGLHRAAYGVTAAQNLLLLRLFPKNPRTQAQKAAAQAGKILHTLPQPLNSCARIGKPGVVRAACTLVRLNWQTRRGVRSMHPGAPSTATATHNRPLHLPVGSGGFNNDWAAEAKSNMPKQ